MTTAEARPGKLSLILNRSRRFLRGLADLATPAAAIITAIRASA